MPSIIIPSQQHNLNHIVYYPRGDGTFFVAYLSLHDSVMFVVVPQMMRVSLDELGNVYRWILQHRAFHAYPFLQTGFLLEVGAC